MKTLKSLYYWTVSLLYLGFVCIAIIVLSFLFDPKRFDPWIKALLRGMFTLIGTQVTVEGSEQLDKNQTYLFMSNHVSLFDVPLLAGFIPNFVRGVEATRQFKWPFYGWAVRRLGNIPIDRKNIHASIKSIHKAQSMLNTGYSIAIMPEGHRTLDGQLRPFKKLPFHLAKESKISIVPIGISGLYTLKAKESWHIQPTPVKLKFGDPIPLETIEQMETVELMNYTRDKIQQLIERP